jgi:hypothetical protein
MSRPEHRYRAYGLHVTSEVPLEPFLAQAAAEGDGAKVTVWVGLPGGNRQSTDVEFSPDGAIRILIRDGALAYIEPRAGLHPVAVAEYVSGIVLAVLLQQRGAFVMHASAVRVNGAVVAFTGRSGAGKSTTAGIFAAAGHPVVTDDFLPLRIDGASVTCVGGPGALKLLEPVRQAGGASTALGKGLSGKWVVRASADHRDDRVAALAAIYSLEDAAEFGVCRVSGQHAIAALLRDAFCLAAAGRRRRALLLEQCAAVAGRVAVRALRRPRDLGRADELVTTVVRDLEEAAPSHE